MRVPDVIPAHEFPLTETLRWLIACKTAFVNGFGGTAAESREAYQRKTVELSQGLGYIFSFDDVHRMILTRRHWLLMQMVGVWLFWSDTRERVLMRAVPLPGRTVWH